MSPYFWIALKNLMFMKFVKSLYCANRIWWNFAHLYSNSTSILVQIFSLTGSAIVKLFKKQNWSIKHAVFIIVLILLATSERFPYAYFLCASFYLSRYQCFLCGMFFLWMFSILSLVVYIDSITGIFRVTWFPTPKSEFLTSPQPVLIKDFHFTLQAEQNRNHI